ncbi:uncharacterized protein LOC111346569 [Stylophora pistillata]|nr:uncharacterized protein LOC111346569 [Stylophora pistillata]
MVKAILSSGGVASLCESITSPPMITCKIDGVSKFSNIEFTTEGIRVWRAYGVEPGKLISAPKTEIPSLDTLLSMIVLQEHPGSFSPIVKGRTTTTHPSETHATRDLTETDGEPATGDEALFTSPEAGCTKTFLRHSSMMQHLDCGKHQRALEHETLFDKAALECAEHLEGQPTLVPVVGTVSSPARDTNRQVMGWALTSGESRRTRFTQSQKPFLTAKFRIGEETGSKANSAAVARSVTCAKDSSGIVLFKSNEFLTANRIAGFYSRLASKKTLVDGEQQGDIEVATLESGLDKIVSEAVRGLTPKHPIVYDAYICVSWRLRRS